VAHEGQGRPVTNGPEHKEEAVADHEHVAKEEGGLHEAGHVGARKEIVEAVPDGKAVDACLRTRAILGAKYTWKRNQVVFKNQRTLDTVQGTVDTIQFELSGRP
jgi:hypothetical protein